MSPQLKLQRRDDPLAVNRPDTTAAGEPPARASGADASASASPPEVAPRSTRSRPARRRAPASSAAPATPAGAVTDAITYDDDRLEQTGWRIYDSIIAEVRERARQLSDAGIPTSAAALAAATLHSRLPRTVEEGTDVMRVYRQASAGRQRGRSDYS